MVTSQWTFRGGRIIGGLGALLLAGFLTVFASGPANAVVRVSAPGGSYEAVRPARIVDTRTGLGAPSTGPTRMLVVATAGRAGVPATGVSAVAVNITVIGGSVPGYVSAYPAGSGGPRTSDVNFERWQTLARMAVVPVDAAGRLTLDASAPAQLVVDVEGYFTSPQAATTRGLFNPVNPSRLMDSRGGRPASPALGPGGLWVLQVTGRGGVPAAGVSAVVINTTVIGPSKNGYVTDFPSGSPRPATSTIDFSQGQNLSNRAIVPVGPGGRISIYNSAGTTLLAIDVTGYFTDGVINKVGGYYVTVPASRMVDTRYWRTTSYMSTPSLKIQKIAGQRCVLFPAKTSCGRALVPPVTAVPRPIAVLLNITAVPMGPGGRLTAFAADSVQPLTSDVNYTGSAAVSDLAFVALTSQGEVSVHVSGGPADVVEDVRGYFVLPAI